MLSLKDYITEAVSTSNITNVADIIGKYLYKKTGMKFIKMPGIEYFSNNYIKNGSGIRYFYDVNKSVRFNFIGTSVKSSKLHSVDIWTGKSKHPNFYLEFPQEVSIIKIVPALVNFILKPHSGKIELIPNSKSLNEDIENNKTLLEAAKAEKYSEAFDDVLTILNSGDPFSFTGLPKQLQTNAQWKIIDFIKKNFTSEFEKRGNRIYFVGNKSTIEKARSEIIEGAGGFSVNVQPGASSETYRLSKKQEESLPLEERVPFKDQIKDLEHLTKLLIGGASNSLLVSGKPGTGKTRTVEKILESKGLTDGDGYFKNTGTVSPIGLFMTLYKYRNEIVLFDDSDNVFSDQEARNILKAATDTKKIRKMVWNKKSSIIVDPTNIDEDDPDSELVPRFFNFTGKIIFISNLQISKLDPDGAMRTRSLIINISPTDDEILEYMKDMLMDFELEDGLTLTKSMREAVFEEVATSKNKSALSLRRLVRALNIAAAADGAMDWKRLVKLYA